MQTLFGFDLSTAQKVIVASVVILVLLVLLGLFVRQIQGGRLRLKGPAGGRARQPRLGVVDTHDLDRQRQLVLIRRDNVEHLIMIGGASDVVVETNIVRSGLRTPTPAPLDPVLSERPAAFDALLPAEPPRQDMPAPPPAAASPKPENPPPPPPPRQAPPLPSRPVTTPPLAETMAATTTVVVPALAAAAALRPTEPPPPETPSVAPPSFARDHAPSPAASPIELDSMARQLEEALKRPFSAVRPAGAQSEPAAVAPPAPEPATVPPPPSKDDALPMPTPPAPPVTSGRPVALPVDVEAELELALGLKPERAKSVEPKPAEFTPAEPKSLAPKPEPEAEPAPTFVLSPAKPAPKPIEEPAPALPEPVLAPEPVAPAVGAPPKADELARPDELPSEPAPEKKPAAIDPFSVDAIEAEFARLLGRDPKAKA